jgi:hypothetical protein
VGTFHHDKGELHGITVVVDLKDDRLYVGRCDTVTPQGVILLDGTVHDASTPVDGGESVSKDAYLAQAVKFGIWKTFDRVVVPTDEVASVKPLGDLAS